MEHGIEAFFIERARARRRVSLFSVSIAALLVVGLWALHLPQVRDVTDRLPFEHFGVEGATRIVPIVRMGATRTEDEALHDLGDVVARRTGGGRGSGEPMVTRRRSRRAENAGPQTGEGDTPKSLVQRALSGEGHVPIFQSEELVIEHLVRPEYPDLVRERGVEGKVAVLALVDTLGKVVDAEVMSRSGEPDLDRAAEVAVRQCRFRPYKESGERREVYAVFRFAFRIY